MIKHPFNFDENGSGWIVPERIFDGERIKDDVALRVADYKISEIVERSNVPENDGAHTFKGLVTPGFLDIQVNGGGGVLFNTSPTTEGILDIVRAHKKLGTSAILPTVITDADEVIAQATDAVLNVFGTYGVAGIHIEGPHISQEKRGTHKTEFIRPLGQVTLDCIQKLRSRDIPVVITLAPEVVKPEDISKIVKMGAVVSIGHSNTTTEITNAAVQAGATLFTHLFNAMSPMQGREPGVVGAAINSHAYCSIICDGIHVSGDMIKLARRARPQADKMIIVSDAMATVGGPSRFELYGQELEVRGGRIVNSEGSLAGAHITMLESVKYLIGTLGFEVEETLRMAITNPASLLSIGHQFNLQGMNIEDCLYLDENWL